MWYLLYESHIGTSRRRSGSKFFSPCVPERSPARSLGVFFRDFGDLGLPGGVPVECQKVSKMNKIHPGASFSATVFWNALLRVTLARFLVVLVI